MKATPASVPRESFVNRLHDVAVSTSDADVFPSEIEAPPASSHFARIWLKRHLLFAGLGILVMVGTATGIWVWSTRAATVATGSLRVESDPPGARVILNGTDRGTTPLTLSMEAGTHQMKVQHASLTRDLPVTVTAGATIVHHITWPVTGSAAGTSAAAGSLQVVSDSPRATVTIDGTERGVTPLTVPDLTPGSHEVMVRSQGVTTRRTVTIEAGATASLVISGQPAGVASGWLSVDSTVPLQILENGRIVGTSESERIMLPSGNYNFEFVNAALGVRRSESVRIAAGQTQAVSVDLPRAPLSINAIPWAQVWIDNRPLGETPIANAMQPVGSHELTFRHPELGERRMTVVVTLKEPARIAVDMRSR